MNNQEIEKLFEKASAELAGLIDDSQPFDEVGYIKAMREIKQELNKRLKAMGVFDKDTQGRNLNSKYVQLLWELYTAGVSHSAQGNYQMQLNAYLELWDTIKIYSEVENEPTDRKSKAD